MNGVPRFNAAYESKVGVIGVVDDADHGYGPWMTWDVHGDVAYFSGFLVKTFRERFNSTSPGDTLTYRNRKFRRYTEDEVDQLNLIRFKDGGLSIFRDMFA